MASIEIVDRSSLISGLYEQLVLNPRETALVTIDMHRGHLDMDVATMPARPEDAKRVIRHACAALDFARAREIPVIHVILVYRRIKNIGSEGMRSPYWKAMHAAQGEKRSEEHTSELQSQFHLVCRLLLEKKKKKKNNDNRRAL